MFEPSWNNCLQYRWFETHNYCLPTSSFYLISLCLKRWFISYVFHLQAFVNLVLTLCDAGDSVVMFAPYYFNAYMSFQMTGVTNILVGPGHPKTLHPDAGMKLKALHSSILFLYPNFLSKWLGVTYRLYYSPCSFDIWEERATIII